MEGCLGIWIPGTDTVHYECMHSNLDSWHGGRRRVKLNKLHCMAYLH